MISMVNLFILHEDPKENVKMYCNKHVVKMGLEAVQILYTAWHELDGTNKVKKRWQYKYSKSPGPYKPFSNAKHPCVLWAMQSANNYEYVHRLATAIFKEYTYRYRKIHKSSYHLRMLRKPPYKLRKKYIGITRFAQAMPEQYKSDNVVTAYRAYYNGEKQHILQYKCRSIPEWLHIVDKKFS